MVPVTIINDLISTAKLYWDFENAHRNNLGPLKLGKQYFENGDHWIQFIISDISRSRDGRTNLVRLRHLRRQARLRCLRSIGPRDWKSMLLLAF